MKRKITKAAASSKTQTTKQKSLKRPSRPLRFKPESDLGETFSDEPIVYVEDSFKDIYRAGRTKLTDEEFKKLIGDVVKVETFHIGIDRQTRYSTSLIEAIIWGKIDSEVISITKDLHNDIIRTCFVRYKNFAWKTDGLQEALRIVDSIRLYELDLIRKIDEELDIEDRLEWEKEIEARRTARKKVKRQAIVTKR